MSSQSYTNRIRILAEASATKVQYPRQIATDNRLSATINCSRNFSPIVYLDICRNCILFLISNLGMPRYSGGNASTQSYIVLDGGNGETNSSNILSGN
jgi:hypothetical protein